MIIIIIIIMRYSVELSLFNPFKKILLLSWANNLFHKIGSSKIVILLLKLANHLYFTQKKKKKTDHKYLRTGEIFAYSKKHNIGRYI